MGNCPCRKKRKTNDLTKNISFKNKIKKFSSDSKEELNANNYVNIKVNNF